MSMEIKSYHHIDGRVSITATFDQFANHSAEAIFSEIARLVAEKYVAENYAAIMARLDQNAISNLAIADCAKKIAEEIRTRPVVYREKGDTYIKRSIF